MKSSFFCAGLVALATALGSAAHAAPVEIFSTDETNPVPDPVTPFDTFEWLAGARVSFDGADTTWFAGSNPLWDPIGGGTECGGAILGGYSLGGCGDTFNNLWYQSVDPAEPSLLEVIVDLTDIPHFFDRTLPSPGSFDSAAGRDYEYDGDTAGGYEGRIGVEYSVPGVSTPTDLYKVMTIDYSGLTLGGTLTGGIIPDSTLTYFQDTDAVVPLPAAGWLLLTGFATLAAMRRRRT